MQDEKVIYMHGENVKVNGNEGMYFAKNRHGCTYTIDIEIYFERV